MRKIFLIIFLLIFLTTYVTANQGIWLTNSEIVALPTSGTAWTYVKSIADQSACTPALAIQADECNTRTLAQALVFVRLGDETYRQKVISELLVVADGNTEAGARSLALGREVGAYVISADLIDLPSYDPALNTRFRTKIRNLLTMYAPGGGVNSLTECAELRPNNWGNHCGATRVAIARYLGDEQILDRQAQVFKGYLGDRSSYAGFDYGELWWQCNQNLPVGLNPQGCTIQGHTVDGVMPDDQRRNSCVFQWPPCKEGYVWEGLQGSTVEAELLYRAGYDAWSWENQALKRALTWLHTPHFAGNTPYPADGNDDTGDDRWTPWLVNFAYGSGFTHIAAPQMGKNMAFTDWTHNRVRTQQTCAQQGGICCAAGNSCSGSSVPASDCSTTCCIGTCLPPDTVPPSVSITSPTNNQQVSGTITITATASDNVQVAGVQFKVDSNNIGSEDTSSPYAVSWNTATVSNGNHILTAVARDTSQNTATSQQINVNVQNIDSIPPDITNVQAVSITSNSASITWTTTNDPSDSQVEYGLTTSYGSQTTLNTNLVTSHSELITGLQASTLYHYRVKSRDSSNNLATSIDFTFATIQSQPGIEQVTYNLQRGLNFITVPLELSNTDIIQVLSPILPEVDKVYSFYNGRWLIFRNRVNAPSSLSTIEPLRGYIVKMKNPRSFTLQGTIDNNRQLQLSSGWSLIGTNSLTSTPISTALQGLSYDSVWSYDTNTNTYIELNLGSGSLNSTKAYWAQLSNAGTFNP